MENPLYYAFTVVSPMIDNGEEKNQDRARWSEPFLTACVCDGVSTSPYSQIAAEIISNYIPVIFSINPVARLEMLADILIMSRNESSSDDLLLSNSAYSQAMLKMLQNVISQKNTISYQTTVIAVKLIPSGKNVLAHVLKCGDSALFAFSKTGDLLSSTLEFNPKTDLTTKKPILFGPGDEILVRIEGKLAEHSIAHKSGIEDKFRKNWLVCSPVESCTGKSSNVDNPLELKALNLTYNDILLVPEFLYGKTLASQEKDFRILKYSSCIKALSTKTTEIEKAGFKDKGNATNVLPDHFYSGDFDLYKDTFPSGTNFLLCSDGFYSGFDDFSRMHEWLVENESNLTDDAKTKKAMQKLHANLKSNSGDDDISFIWVRPEQEGESNA